VATASQFDQGLLIILMQAWQHTSALVVLLTGLALSVGAFICLAFKEGLDTKEVPEPKSKMECLVCGDMPKIPAERGKDLRKKIPQKGHQSSRTQPAGISNPKALIKGLSEGLKRLVASGDSTAIFVKALCLFKVFVSDDEGRSDLENFSEEDKESKMLIAEYVKADALFKEAYSKDPTLPQTVLYDNNMQWIPILNERK